MLPGKVTVTVEKTRSCRKCKAGRQNGKMRVFTQEDWERIANGEKRADFRDD
ncbi:MAG: hypothetical protein ACLT0Y_02205 [Christensenellales bacterium]